MTKIAEDIAEIKTGVSWIKKTLEIHMTRHFQVRLAMIGSLIAAGTAILIAIL